MKLGNILTGLSIILLFGIVGCGSDDASGSKGGSGEFKEIDSIDVEGHLALNNFFIRDDGEALNYGEKDDRLAEPDRMKVWVDGEIEELDMETFDHFSYLHPEGNIYTTVNDSNNETTPYTLVIYDPRTGESEEFLKTVEPEDFFHVGPRYVSEEEGLIPVRSDGYDELNFYLWDYQNDEIEMYELTEELYELFGEIERTHEPKLALSRDAKSLYISYTEGISHYNTETGELNEVSIGEDMDANSVKVTLDNQYAVTRKYTGSEEIMGLANFYITDRDSFEQKEIGEGTNIFPIAAGKIVIQKENELTVYDTETDETSPFYTIELGEEEDLKKVLVSGDGNTIAYGYKKKEDDEEDKTIIKIIRR
ncbi:hypothetical protein [Gracilibacillus saliphilus]|uniref:hypothetical protein n=1 Tax=Gracilibacillus saliphilus TaxID=543890 RepID=UPI0013D45267|nr:hypothetical protein [Gracilibacillus saliphilus]